MNPPCWLSIAAAGLLLWSSPCAAATQAVHRCIASDGNTVFTDRTCDEMQAVERMLPAPAPSAAQATSHVRQCPRTPDALLSGVRSALQAQDVNQLASFYHWTGVSSTESVRVMTELDALARHPLVDVLLQHSAGAAPSENASPIPAADAATPAATRQAPDRIRIEQLARSGSATPLSTVLRLHKNRGCWWIRY